jgi:UDP-N-acetylmuramoyl-tripeptide--D-alanyl-D-alanine ligase
MIDITFQQLKKWLEADSQNFTSDFKITNINSDSRSLKKGELFVALKGEKFDGHDYISQAIEKGAAAILSEKAEGPVPTLLVKDTLRALVCIAQNIREQFKGPVIAITGSAGKSSTKEMTAVLLGPHTVSSPASFNNLLGVSKTIFLIEPTTQKLVLEMGMNALYEIKEMVEIFKPDIGVITNIGDAHLGKMGGLENIYKAKKEMFDYVATSTSHKRAIVLNQDDPKVLRAYQESGASKLPTLTYSASGKAADVRLLSCQMDSKTAYLDVEIEIKEQKVKSKIKIFGEHHKNNICAAIAAALQVGVSIEEIKSRLINIKPAKHRGEIKNISRGITLIDESYNSNFTALKSSLTTLAHFAKDRRKVLVIGEMLELDGYAEKFHKEMGAFIQEEFKDSKIVLYSVGNFSKFLGAAKHYDKVEQIISDLKLSPEDIVFIKGSRGIALDKLVSALE